MADEPTAWEDINPPMVSAPPHGQLSRCSDRLKPATSTEFRDELTACLALVVPVGMTEEGRREWLAVAWETLKHLPGDVLSSGCRIARETCDHPSKIVPAIVAATREDMRLRRDARQWDSLALPRPEPNYCTPEEAAEILRSVGLKSSYSPGSKPDGRDLAEGLDAQHESRK